MVNRSIKVVCCIRSTPDHPPSWPYLIDGRDAKCAGKVLDVRLSQSEEEEDLRGRSTGARHEEGGGGA